MYSLNNRVNKESRGDSNGENRERRAEIIALQSRRSHFPWVSIVFVQAITEILEVEMLAPQDTLSDELVYRGHNLLEFVIGKFALENSALYQKFDVLCVDDEQRNN